jgi:hypothetical protein
MTDSERIIELQKQIEETTDFLLQMELLDQKQDLELKAGILKPTKPIDYGEGCGDMCGA